MMPSCKDVTEEASAYLAGELPRRRRWMLRLHLAMCSHCRRYLRQLQVVVATVGGLKPPPSADEELGKLAADLYRRAGMNCPSAPQ